MEWESDSPCHSHTDPRHGRRSPGRCRSWQLKFRDYGAIPGWGLLLTVEKWIEGMWGRRLWWEMPVEERRATMEAKSYCWVMHRGWGHHHSLSLPTHKHLQLKNRETGPSNAWYTELKSRTPARAAPSMCLMGQTTVKDPRQGSPLSAWAGGVGERLAKEAFWSPATTGSKEDSDRAMTPEAVCVPADGAVGVPAS